LNSLLVNESDLASIGLVRLVSLSFLDKFLQVLLYLFIIKLIKFEILKIEISEADIEESFAAAKEFHENFEFYVFKGYLLRACFTLQ